MSAAQGHRPSTAQREAGWLRQRTERSAGLFRELPPQPTAWEVLLGEMGLREHEAAQAALRMDVRGVRLRDFVKREKFSRFVPEEILTALKLDNLVERKITHGEEVWRFQSRSKRRGARLPVGAGD